MLALVLGLVVAGLATTPQLVPLQGRLMDSGGLLQTGDYTMLFSIYDVSSGGSSLWSETQTVSVNSGAFAVQLGSNVTLSLDFYEQLWVGVKVGSDSEMTPRIKLGSSPYARVADAVNGSGNVFPGSGNVGVGTLSPSSLLHLYGDAPGITLSDSVESSKKYQIIADTDFSGTNAVGLYFQNNAGTTRMVLNDNGNVGIGTASPGYKLEINDDAASGAGLKITGGGSGGNLATFVRDIGGTGTISITASGGDPQIYFASASNTFALGTDGTSFKISDSGTVGTNDRLTIDSTGQMVVSGSINGLDIAEITPNIFQKKYSSFEEYADGGLSKGVNGGGSAAVSSDYGLDGTKSYKITTSGTDGWAVIDSSLGLAVRPSTKYAMSFYAYRATAGGGLARVQIYTRENGTGLTYRSCELYTAALGTGQWVRCSTTFTTAADTTQLTYYRFDVDSDGVNSETVYFDAIQIEEITSDQTTASAYRSPSFNSWSDSVSGIHFQGNVGIGTESPGAKLDVRPVPFSASQTGGILLGNTANNQWDSSVYIRSDSGGIPRLSISGPGNTDDLVISQSGNVGIGMTSPLKSLDVNGTIAISGGENSFLSGKAYAAIYKSTVNTGSFPFDVIGNLVIQARGSSGDTRSISFITGTTPATRMTILGTGNVGIGTASPSATLDLVPSSGVSLELGRTAGNPNLKSSDGYLIMDSNGNVAALNWYVSDNVIIANGGGNVGIGTTTPTSKLHVAGNVNISNNNLTDIMAIKPTAGGDICIGNC